MIHDQVFTHKLRNRALISPFETSFALIFLILTECVIPFPPFFQHWISTLNGKCPTNRPIPLQYAVFSKNFSHCIYSTVSVELTVIFSNF